MIELHHPVGNLPALHPPSLSEVDDVRLRGGVATATGEIMRIIAFGDTFGAGATDVHREHPGACSGAPRVRARRGRKERRPGTKRDEGGG